MASDCVVALAAGVAVKLTVVLAENAAVDAAGVDAGFDDVFGAELFAFGADLFGDTAPIAADNVRVRVAIAFSTFCCAAATAACAACTAPRAV